MHLRTPLVLVLIPLLHALAGCDLIEPSDPPYNQAAHPPEESDLQALGIAPGEGLGGQIYFVIDPAIGVPRPGTVTLLMDGGPIDGAWVSSGTGAGSTPATVGFDTRAFPDGVHMLTVGLMKSADKPPETGLLGYLGVPDMLFSGQVVITQTSPYALPVVPAGERPAVDAARNTLYVLDKDSVKAFSTLTNALLRARCWNTTGYTYNWYGQIVLSADGTRLYVHSGDLGGGTHLSVLNSLTFDSLARVPAHFPVSEIVRGSADRLYVASAPGQFFVPGGGGGGILRVLDGVSLEQIAELELPISPPMKMVAPDNPNTLFLASDGVCRVSVAGGVPTLQMHKATRPVESIGISPGAQQLFVFFNENPFDWYSSDHLTVMNPSTLDSSGVVGLQPTTNVWDILPSGQNLFMVMAVFTGSQTPRVAKYSGLNAMTASWDFQTYETRLPLQVSADGRFLYASAGATFIPLP